MKTLEKTWMEVLNVIPSKKEVTGRLRDGGTVSISINEIPPVFRWPEEGEIWSISRSRLDNISWNLGSRIHYIVKDQELPITDMDAGDLRLDAEKVYNRIGQRLLVEGDIEQANDAHIEHIQSPASDTWVITHTLSKHPSVTVIDSAGSVILPDIEYDGLNSITLRFNGATAGTAYLN